MQKIEEELYWLDIYQKYSSRIYNYPQYNYIVHINYPVYHPEVFCGYRLLTRAGLHVGHSGYIFAENENDAIEKFTNINAKNPANIDAAVCYMKNKPEFWKINDELAKAYQQDCRICWKPLSNNDPLVYACHVFHKNCVREHCYVCHEKIIF